ncbi:hypothetical protein VP395_13805 [Mariniflexile soesokkakense]|uniref:Uncharacterized protein n=1 Tax=Mariniflexile soesokkakense TaxID=1343160 RepID=A0ABV0AD32_9FLAO
MASISRLIGISPSHKVQLKAYNFLYEVKEEVGFKDLDLSKLKKLSSKIVIERHIYTTSPDRIVIHRFDEVENPSGLRFFKPLEVPDKVNKDRKSTIELKITAPTTVKNSNMVYTLSQNITIYEGSASTLYKLKGIKLIISDVEAYLVYPNGMGRIYIS